MNFNKKVSENLNSEDSTAKEINKSNIKLILVIIFIILLAGVLGYFLFVGQGLSILGIGLRQDTSESSVVDLPGADTVLPLEEDFEQNTAVGSTVAVNESIPKPAGKAAVVSGIQVGSLFIPSSFDQEALAFLNKQIKKGELPVIVEDSALGKPNPFLK